MTANANSDREALSKASTFLEELLDDTRSFRELGVPVGRHLAAANLLEKLGADHILKVPRGPLLGVCR